MENTVISIISKNEYYDSLIDSMLNYYFFNLTNGINSNIT